MDGVALCRRFGSLSSTNSLLTQQESIKLRIGAHHPDGIATGFILLQQLKPARMIVNLVGKQFRRPLPGGEDVVPGNVDAK